MVTDLYSWGNLPSVVVCNILNYLELSDRLRATSVCRQWRSCLWQPFLWRVVRFKLVDNSDQRDGCWFVAQKCGPFVHEATFEFYSRSYKVVNIVRKILELLGPNVQKIAFKPSSCQMEWSSRERNMEEAVRLFTCSLERAVCRSRYLRHLSLGCITEIADNVKKLLQTLQIKQHGSQLQVLHIGSIKEDPSSYTVDMICPDVILTFTKLHTLSIDYDHLTEEMLYGFVNHGKTNLQKLIIHVHDSEPNHNHISDNCWHHLSLAGDVGVTLNLLHSQYGSINLPHLISPSMPLTHFRSFFCGHLNVHGIRCLGQQVGRNLQSFLVVDGMNGISHPNTYKELADVDEDPFVMLAWKCPNLSSFTFIGYEISHEDIIAISRLRGHQLANLDIPCCCIVPSYEEISMEDFIKEVSSSLGHQWNPLSDEDLHPAVISEGADAETFYLDILHSDMN